MREEEWDMEGWGREREEGRQKAGKRNGTLSSIYNCSNAPGTWEGLGIGHVAFSFLSLPLQRRLP